jgi:xanthine dehydrogenase accessory factor
MTHELKTIFESFALAKKQGLKTVLATVVDLEGSSYRKPGVRMLIWENSQMVGAVSGGCVEKEVVRQAQTVFNSGVSKVMTYDGRYRLGCEGVLYILLEPFNPNANLINAFEECLEKRNTFLIDSTYIKYEGTIDNLGSVIKFSNDKKYSFSGRNELNHNGTSPELLTFIQKMPPCFKLIIIGAEHDAVELCLLAFLSGWEVTVVSSLSDPKTLANFPGAKQVGSIEAESFNVTIDDQTAVVLMTHNYARDLKYLVALKDSEPVYIGLLGARNRKEKLISQFLELQPDANWEFIASIHGPAGLDIGAITPQEIAVSIISEILSVQRDKEALPPNNKLESTHP